MSNPWSQAYEELRKPYLEGKMAKKDYDGDGKIETGTQEYMGSRDKAIKKAMGKKIAKEHHQKDKDGNTIPHEDTTPSSVEEENINELSNKTLGGYIKKASKETRGNMVATQHGSGISKKGKDIKLKQVNKRLKGMEKAGEKMAKEELVNELSTDTLGRYVKTASFRNKHQVGKKYDDRKKSIEKAGKKMAKEELVNEMITLTKGDYFSRNVVGSAYNTAAKKKFDPKIYKAGGGLGANFLPLANSHEPEGDTIEEKKKDLPTTKMYRKAGNLSRTALSKGLDSKEGSKAQDRSSKIVSTISREKEKERFSKMKTPAAQLRNEGKQKMIKKESFSDWRSEFVWEDGDSVKKT